MLLEISALSVATVETLCVIRHYNNPTIIKLIQRYCSINGLEMFPKRLNNIQAFIKKQMDFDHRPVIAYNKPNHTHATTKALIR